MAVLVMPPSTRRLARTFPKSHRAARQDWICTELVVAFTDVTQAADVIGKPALIPAHIPYERLVASLDVGVVRPRVDYLSRLYLYQLFKGQDFQAHTYGRSNGSTVLHLQRNAIETYRTALPPPVLLNRFTELVQPLAMRRDMASHESDTLATLRDLLLPKLLSGEIRVGEATEPVRSATKSSPPAPMEVDLR